MKNTMKFLLLLLLLAYATESISFASQGRVACNETIDCFRGRCQIGTCWKNFCVRPCRRQNACLEGTWCDDLLCYSGFCQNINCPPLNIPDKPPVGKMSFY